MLNIVLFGPPGAGKGTQSQFLVDHYKLIHLSTGDLLRGEITQGTELGLQAKTLMDKGDLVPDSVVIGMIRNKLKSNQHAAGFIFDGFPRTIPQAEALDSLLEEYGESITAMLSLQVPEQELVKRLLLRGKDSGRNDDKDETIIQNRIKEYNTKTAPVASYFEKQNKLKIINGVGSIDQIAESLKQAIA
ncbi:MAG: adenylate kinase [Bacteroidia bacterium]